MDSQNTSSIIVIEDKKVQVRKRRVLIPKPGTDGTWNDEDWYYVEIDEYDPSPRPVGIDDEEAPCSRRSIQHAAVFGEALDGGDRSVISIALAHRSSRTSDYSRLRLHMAAGILAFIDLVRHDPGVMLAKVASAGGNNNSSLHNATNRFIDKVGRAGDPTASMVERVRAAFPPRG